MVLEDIDTVGLESRSRPKPAVSEDGKPSKPDPAAQQPQQAMMKRFGGMRGAEDTQNAPKLTLGTLREHCL